MPCFRLLAFVVAVTANPQCSTTSESTEQCTLSQHSLMQKSSHLHLSSRQSQGLDKAVLTAAQTLHDTGLNATQLYQHLDLIGQQLEGKEIEGHSQQYLKERQAMNNIATDPRIRTICETGFNCGHGTLRWLLHSNPQVHVYSFDIGVHKYSQPAAKFLEDTFPGRHTAIWGDSTQTLPKFHQQNPDVKCNIIFVDGGHDLDVAQADLKNFMAMADPAYNVVMIDDFSCSAAYCQGPNKAWHEMVLNGQITQTSQDDDMSDTRGFALGTYKFIVTPQNQNQNQTVS